LRFSSEHVEFPYRLAVPPRRTAGTQTSDVVSDPIGADPSTKCRFLMATHSRTADSQVAVYNASPQKTMQGCGSPNTNRPLQNDLRRGAFTTGQHTNDPPPVRARTVEPRLQIGICSNDHVLKRLSLRHTPECTTTKLIHIARLPDLLSPSDLLSWSPTYKRRSGPSRCFGTAATTVTPADPQTHQTRRASVLNDSRRRLSWEFACRRSCFGSRDLLVRMAKRLDEREGAGAATIRMAPRPQAVGINRTRTRILSIAWLVSGTLLSHLGNAGPRPALRLPRSRWASRTC